VPFSLTPPFPPLRLDFEVDKNSSERSDEDDDVEKYRLEIELALILSFAAARSRLYADENFPLLDLMEFN
jgi:hypothetical protein